MDFLWLVPTIRLIDILDILLLSFILYRAVIILQGTKAFQSLAGLFFLMLVYALSYNLGLTGVYWLLDKFFVYVVLAIIILFQEDIKKGLARAGQFVPNFQEKQELSMLENVIKTVFILSNRHIGALIAIQRQASLDEPISTGTMLDAYVSQELLTTIFLPTSPLHDGAVVINNDRLIAAKCIIPLNPNKSLSKVYGTRHRAAVSITDATDAIVIVVSEERGTVGLSVNGELEIITSANALRQRLQELTSKTT